MVDFLFECLSEEVPAKMQNYVVERMYEILKSQLKKSDLEYKTLHVFTTPRRFTIIINGLPAFLNSKSVELRGPRVGATETAVLGFLKKVGGKKEELEIKKTEKGEFYFFYYKEESLSTQITLQTLIEDLLANFNWPKSMRWYGSNVRWIRPIKNLLCLFDGATVPVEFAGLRATNKTCGHRFRVGWFSVSSLQDYLEKLEKNYVILDQNQRLKIIKTDLIKIANENNFHFNLDEDLLKEMANLTEYPKVLLGTFESRYLALPKELLITVMKSHQKYHHLLDSNGTLVPFFIFVSNNGDDEMVIKGNEKVIAARLEDAKFLIEQDLRNNLSYYADKLSNVVFHSKLGSIEEKVERVTTVSKYISVWVPNVSLIDIEKAAKLIKADLATDLVKEFPELQGIIGGYYAEKAGEEKVIVDAIREHYYPINAESVCTQEPIAVALSIADKIDSMVGLFSIGERASGSRDPFSLRRLAIGISRTVLENQVLIPLDLIIDKAIHCYPINLFKKRKRKEAQDKLYRDFVVEEILDFCMARFRVMMKSQGIDENVFYSITSSQKMYVLNIIYKNCNYLSKFLQEDEGRLVLVVYKRIKNIVNDAPLQGKIGRFYKTYNRSLFIDEEEVILSSHLTKIGPELKLAIKENEIEFAMSLLVILLPFVKKFIDCVLINHENNDVRRNRLLILSYVKHLFNCVVNFDYLINVVNL